MTYDNWKTASPDDEPQGELMDDQGLDELELVYAALHRALEQKCALVKALERIMDGLANLENVPGRRDLRWMSRSTKHDMWRVARDALAALEEVKPCSGS